MQMQCPVDGETLVMADRSGVEIDYCPKCRGVWLDRGELDKIIDRAAPAATPVQPAPARSSAPVYQAEPHQTRHDHDDRRRHKDDDDDYRYKRKRKDSFLSDLFDF
jgi:Zn-finger nucleic acid-binding protein